MDRDEIESKLRRGIFVSAMLGVLDGKTAALVGRHACMIQLPAIIKEDLEHITHDPRFCLPGEEEEYVELLRGEIAPIREALGAVPVAWNTATGDVDSAIRFANAAERAGADLYELNFNGGYGKLIKRTIIRAMVLPQNRDTLLEWVRELVERARIPIVAKFFAGMHGVDFGEVAEQLSGFDLFGLHLNVRSLTEMAPDVEVVRRVRPRFDGVLMCSGRVTRYEHAAALFEAGADCVGVARGLVEDGHLVSKLFLAGKRYGWPLRRRIAPSAESEATET